jgi:hypothetical protein
MRKFIPSIHNTKSVILLVLILVLILALINQLKQNFGEETLENSLYNGDNWNKYRLGDVFYRELDSDFFDPSSEINILYHKTEYLGSIANEYINKKTKNINYKLLREIIESRVNDKNTYPETLFLHIRIGDVLCDKTEWLIKINGPLRYSKFGDDQWWNGVKEYILSNNIKRVVIIAGSHSKQCLTESIKYIEDRKNFFEREIPGIKVEYRLGQSPDDDVRLVYYVKHFITTGGEYGKMMKEIKNN